MKNFFYIIILLLMSFNLSYSSPKWYIECVDNTQYVGDFISTKIDKNNYPHISYSEYGSYYDALRYAYFDGSKWNIEIVDNNGDLDGYTSIAIDSKGNPHIAYQNTLNNNEGVRYAYFNGSKWNITNVDNGPLMGNGISLDLDSKEYPHITYCDWNGKNEDLKYAYFDGSEWHIEKVDTEGRVGLSTSIAIDSKDHVHISYYDETNDDLKYAFFDGSKWIITRVDTEGSVGWGSSIVIDSYNKPHIAYADITNDFIKYAYWDGRSWIISKVDDSDGGGLPSLDLDSKDLPHISYIYWVDYDPNEKLKYVYNNGSKWVTSVVDVSSGPISYQSLDLDKSYFPHIAYEKFDNLYYARYGYGVGIDLTLFTAMPHNGAITLNWSVSTDEDISGFNLYRRILPPGAIHKLPLQNTHVGEIHESPSSAEGEWTKVNTSLITGTNPYSYTDRDIAPETTYEYKLDAVVSDRYDTLGTTSATSGNGTPASFNITKVYPTPASSQINIDVVIPEQSDIDIGIYDISGRRVSTIASGLYNQGEYTLTCYISGLINGVYIIRMTTGELSASKNFVIAR